MRARAAAGAMRPPPRRDPLASWNAEQAPDEPPKPYRPVRLETAGGPVACRHYEASGARAAMIWIGGVGGGWDTPAQDLYPRLAQELTGHGIDSLRVRFRDPTDMRGCVEDVAAVARWLAEERRVEALGVCGHSFGGAVAIRAAALLPQARTVVALAPQAAGAQPAALLAPRCSLLLVHGLADEVLPADCSRHVEGIAREPKRLVLYPGAGHVLDEVADAVTDEVRAWVLAALSPSRDPSPAAP